MKNKLCKVERPQKPYYYTKHNSMVFFEKCKEVERETVLYFNILLQEKRSEVIEILCIPNRSSSVFDVFSKDDSDLSWLNEKDKHIGLTFKDKLLRWCKNNKKELYLVGHLNNDGFVVDYVWDYDEYDWMDWFELNTFCISSNIRKATSVGVMKSTTINTVDKIKKIYLQHKTENTIGLTVCSYNYKLNFRLNENEQNKD